MQKDIINQFDAITDELLQLLSSLNHKQLNAKPVNGGWSAGQIGEHLVKSYAVAETLNGSVKSTDRPANQKVEELGDLFLNFNIKMNSPEAIVPSDGTVDKEALLSSLKIRIQQIKEAILNKDLSLVCTDFAIPNLGEFTRLEWAYFVVFHTRRHVHQLKKIVENPEIATYTE